MTDAHLLRPASARPTGAVRARPLRAARSLLAALALAAAGVLAGPVAPSSAHAELLSSTPANGASLSAVPATAGLTFSDEIDAKFVRAAVTSPGGTGTVKATTAGPLVTVPIPSAGPGDYRVVYRVVSADGHPISGELRFTVAGTPTASPTASAAAPSAAAPSVVESSAAQSSAATPPVAAADPSGSAASGGTSWLVVGAIGLAAVAGVGGVVAATRGRRS